jgi:dTMP kinase
MRGKLIVFEGPDSVGKTTLVSHVKTLLDESQVQTEFLSFPGDRPGTIGRLVYELHHAPEKFGIEQISPIGLQALHIAAHLDAIAFAILPAMNAGTWVVLDRFWWSTWVYGCAAGIDARILDSLIATEKLLWGVNPSVVFLLQRTGPLSDKPRTEEFKLISDLYHQLAERETGNYEIITVTDSDPDVASGIVLEWMRKSRGSRT